MTAYAASKGAIIAFGTGLARELAPYSIRVNTVCPAGWIRNSTVRPSPTSEVWTSRPKPIRNNVPLGRQAVPAEIAPIYVYLASDESSFMTAQSVLVDGGQFN